MTTGLRTPIEYEANAQNYDNNSVFDSQSSPATPGTPGSFGTPGNVYESRMNQPQYGEIIRDGMSTHPRGKDIFRETQHQLATARTNRREGAPSELDSTSAYYGERRQVGPPLPLRSTASLSDSRLIERGSHSGTYHVAEREREYGQQNLSQQPEASYRSLLVDSEQTAEHGAGNVTDRFQNVQVVTPDNRYHQSRAKSPMSNRSHVLQQQNRRSQVLSSAEVDYTQTHLSKEQRATPQLHNKREIPCETTTLRERPSSEFYSSQWSLQQALAGGRGASLLDNSKQSPYDFSRAPSRPCVKYIDITPSGREGHKMNDDDRNVSSASAACLRSSSDLMLAQRKTTLNQSNGDVRQNSYVQLSNSPQPTTNEFILGHVINLVLFSILSLVLTIVGLLLLLRVTSRASPTLPAESNGLISSNFTYQTLHTVVVALSCSVIALDLTCLIVCSMQGFLLVKLLTCLHGHFR